MENFQQMKYPKMLKVSEGCNQKKLASDFINRQDLQIQRTLGKMYSYTSYEKFVFCEGK